MAQRITEPLEPLTREAWLTEEIRRGVAGAIRTSKSRRARRAYLLAWLMSAANLPSAECRGIEAQLDEGAS